MSFVLLLVDDNEDHRLLTRRAIRDLETAGLVQVVTANDGEEALEKIRGGLRPGLLLMDIKMPRRDGFDVLGDLRGDPDTAGLRVVLLSSSENRADVARAMALGADDYVTKPLDPLEFRAKVRATVHAWMVKAGIRPG